MRRKTTLEYIYSKSTMCLDCHLVVEMVHDSEADPMKGAWECPRCGRKYPFAFWKIRKQVGERSKAA